MKPRRLIRGLFLLPLLLCLVAWGQSSMRSPCIQYRYPHTLDFGSGNLDPHTADIAVSYWILTLVFSSLLFLVWRKTPEPPKNLA